MKLATIRDGSVTRAVRADGDAAVDLGAAEVGEVLRRDGWQARAAAADGRRCPADLIAYVSQIITLVPGDVLSAADARLAAAASDASVRWDAPVRTARGRTVPASDVPWMRAREVWVHAVDLDAGLTFDSLPAAMTAALLDDVAAAFAARPDVPFIELRATDSGRRWMLGSASGGVVPAVTGTTACLAAYATGRPVPAPLGVTGAAGRLPALPAWL